MAELGEVAALPSEEIPDGDSLYLRVHHKNIVNDEATPAAFRAHDGGLSTDWSRYATPEWTRANAGPHPEKGTPRGPELYGVVVFVVGPVRAVPNVLVKHKPKIDNRAHTDIEYSEGDKEQVRVELGRLWEWSIKRED
jgi:hypothetical protein